MLFFICKRMQWIVNKLMQKRLGFRFGLFLHYTITASQRTSNLYNLSEMEGSGDRECAKIIIRDLFLIHGDLIGDRLNVSA